MYTRPNLKRVLIVPIFAILCLTSLLLSACTPGVITASPSPSPSQTGTSPSASASPGGTDAENEQAITSMIEDFGSVLKNVSLLAPADILNKSMDDNYTPFATPELLATWKADPTNAPGRLTSSPWPDRIGLFALEKKSDGVYIAGGNVIEVTSTEAESGGAADVRPFTANVVLIDGRWLISSWSFIVSEDSIVYHNRDYGFDFRLPAGWEGYTVVAVEWQGTRLNDGIMVSGPELWLRSPLWTSSVPTYDIPVMVLTLPQWDEIQKENLAVSAAPVPPTELGRNSAYVFALPPRYDFYDYPGRADVVAIMSSSPLSPTENIGIRPDSMPGSSTASPGTAVRYDNRDYGFTFDLPENWTGYTIVSETWEGTPLTAGRQPESGPQLLIRNPKWTSQNPMQDIPIMVFTIDQWGALQRAEYSVSAAPIPPSELGHNAKYVFALPARYNFAYLPGFEEVETIMNSKPLHPYDQ